MLEGGLAGSHKHRSGSEYVYRAAVGGFVVGYKGHRPGSKKLIGETTFGGVPKDMERAGLRQAPGMGFGPRQTTSHMELGTHYGPKAHADSRDAFNHYAYHCSGSNIYILNIVCIACACSRAFS